jgi:hypothetical protein
VLLHGNTDTVTYQAEQVLGGDYVRFDIPLGTTQTESHAVNDDFDDALPRNIAVIPPRPRI